MDNELWTGKTAYEMVNKRKLNIKFFRVFGCVCYLLNNIDDLGKFDAKSDESIFIGYSLNSATYRVYNKRTRSIFESRYVDFSETEMYSDASTSTASPIFPELTTVSPPSTSIPTDSFESDFVDLAEFDLTTLVGPIIVPAPSEHTIPSSTSISTDAFVNESSSCSTAVGETSSGTVEPLSSTQPSPKTAVEAVREQTMSPVLAPIPEVVPPPSPSRTYAEVVREPCPETVLNTDPDASLLSTAIRDENDSRNNMEYDPIPHSRKWTRSHSTTNIIGSPSAPVTTRSSKKDENLILFGGFLSQFEPTKTQDALSDPDWVRAMQEELAEFERNRVWRLVERPRRIRIIDLRWIFRNEKDENDLIIRNKARLVAKGYRQQEVGDNNKMEFKEVDLEEIKHEHPLILVDLQELHQDYVEDDEDVDDADLIALQNFKCECAICGFRIDWYHRYYYKCKEHLSCNYSVHKSCAKMTTTLQFRAHPNHTLILKKATSSDKWKCDSCHKVHHELGKFCYVCSTCDYVIDLLCVTFAEQNTIHHPGHPHPLTYVILSPILSLCYACGTEEVGRICRKKFSSEYWLYKCSKCLYYIHLECATSMRKSSTSILSSGVGKRERNFEVNKYPCLLNFPLPNESYNILSHQTCREKNNGCCEKVIDDDGYLKHSSHEHPLVLFDAKSTSRTSPLHNPMKMIKVLCNGCVRPITGMPFYKCNEGGCDFYLHEWCTRLPTELQNHPTHPQHTLVLFFLKHQESYKVFTCKSCDLKCNGFGYACSQCDEYCIDVHCGFIPQHITHEAHVNHLLSRFNVSTNPSTMECDACHGTIGDSSRIYFRCNDCDFYLDSSCALHLPRTIRHKYDKHLLKLSYIPIENHSSQYFCDVCEEYLNPNNWFYHCSGCSQSIHSACAPFILKSEQGGAGLEDVGGVCHVINIKFGGIVKEAKLHQHPLSFALGTTSDGDCSLCTRTLQCFPILKCFQCNFAIHSTSCGLAKRQLDWNQNQSKERQWDRKNWERQFQTRIAFYPSGFMRPVASGGSGSEGLAGANPPLTVPS
ncbi:hypothetical protein OSB04_020734 [Centaurea solstitialis]|uniref:Phorbol-ester/DAG-type domain-containing protein n=1 Tax=Centaurea solstitialis TaxID=347529 RepID=A0AA38T699_9ASTR|nr:hypothetical protein OSB04_020734 [Centaurea solstitialis]